MYPHHEKAIGQMRDYFAAQDGVIAIVLDGSVARGRERIDSDIDGIIVVTPERYEQQRQKDVLAEAIHGVCEYEGGYLDIKYFTKEQLAASADHGSEPTRCAYLCSRVLYTVDDEIPGIVARIPVFQQGEKREKLAVFYADMMMNHEYYWPMEDKSNYLKLHTASEIVYAAFRMVLQENETLFSCNRELQAQVAEAPSKPEGIIALADAFMEKLDDESEKQFVQAILDWTSFTPDSDKLVFSKYVEYYEQWWYSPRPFVNEW